jgi:FkbM family methyltransferase
MGIISTLQHMHRAWRHDRRQLGFQAGTRWFLLNGLNERGRLRSAQVRMRPQTLEHPIELRMQASSDSAVFRQVFIGDEYAFIERLENVRTVIDLGANIGLASALFLSRWPHCTVLSVEPDPGNAALLRRNLAPYGTRGTCLQGAAWPESAMLRLSPGTFGDGREWATEVKPLGAHESDGDVRGYAMAELMALADAREIDLLKIDIEGSEAALFSRNTGWLDRVRNLSIELHGVECERIFRAALRGYRWREHLCGEYTVCQDLQRV